jgi:transcriptional regulator with XRE-family HTH domain
MNISSLRTIRQQRSLTLDELGLRARIERSKLSRAERGYALLHRDELGRIARVLKVRVAEIGSRGR